MSAGFGFSAGDFVKALELVGTVIKALQESGGAGSDFRELVQELYTLESALLRVKRVELDEDQKSEGTALQQAASQCQRTIDSFYQKIQKYQPYLGMDGSGSRVKNGWMKIRWAVCKQDDVANFKASLRAHTSSIEILIATIQMNNTSMQGRKNDHHHNTLAGMVQESSLQYIRKLATLTHLVTGGVHQGMNLLEMTAQIMRTNVQIFQVVRKLQGTDTHIPAQINRQQPVYMIDALGKATPFHLEFIQSAEALTAVLKSNMRNTKIGPRKIDRGESVIQETSTKRDIDLASDWDLCFLPGQRVEMSMIFQHPGHYYRTCPSCHTTTSGSGIEDVDCQACGINFRRVTEVYPDINSSTNDQPVVVHASHPLLRTAGDQFSLTRKRFEVKDEETRLFRRVRISCMSFTSATLYESKTYLLFIDKNKDHEVIYETHIEQEHGFQKRQDSLIVWTSLCGDRFELSFPNANACTRIWQRIQKEREKDRSWHFN